jgi:glycosyltransferase involved in cell wall biosynthesis
MPEVSIILPAYNEARRLEKTVERVAVEMSGMAVPYEIIIAEDGAKDGTDAIAARLAEHNPQIRHIHSDARSGRGRALNRSFASTDADIVIYCDVDLATDTKHIRQLINAIREGNDVATGSRLMRDSDVERPFNREFASRGYNYLVRFLLRSRIYDHQCGFKAFNRKTITPLLTEIKDTHWFWDTELLVRAQRKGLKVYEFPVHWRHGGATTVNLKRDVFYMGSRVFRLWFDLIRGQ